MAYSAHSENQETVFTCPHINQPVQVATQVVYPSSFFRDLPPRVVQRTCSGEFDCVLVDKSACPVKVEEGRRNSD